MGRIYTAADIVIMWLGNDTSDLEKFVFLHEKFLPEVDKTDIDPFTTSLWDLPFLEEIGIENTEQWREYWAAYHRFYYRRRFFYRAWIVQEYALGRKQVFACGPSFTILHPNLMNRLSSYVQNSLWYEELQYLDLPLDKIAYPMDVMLQVRGEVFEERLDSRDFIVTKGGPEGLWQKRIYESLYGATTPEARWFCFLLRLLLRNRALGATDARDKIYSVLGLANLHLPKDLPEPIIPDYHLSMREVYVSVSAQIVRSIPYLDILSEVHDRPGCRNNSLPSWVPDYASMAACEPLTSLGARELSSLSGDETEHTQPVPGGIYDTSLVQSSGSVFRDIERDVLVVKGARFAVVDEVSQSFDFVFQPLGIFTHLKICSKIPPIYQATGQSRVEVLWRTLIADFHDGQHPAADMSLSFRDYVMWILCHYIIFDTSNPTVTTETLMQLQILDELVDKNPCSVLFGSSEVFERVAILRSELGHLIGKEHRRQDTFFQLPRGTADRFDHIVTKRMENRSIYRTADGHLGLGPASLGRGDEVWMIEGAVVPFILRRVQGTEDKVFSLVGETYIHGFMHGEMLTDDLKARIAKIRII
jgi:hypothetical protein